MRYGSAARRMRNNNNSNRGGNQRRGTQNKNKVFDSNGPDVRIRGTAYQIVEKYMALAKDSNAAGDRVLAESYLQYAEHYQRIINSWEEEDASYDTYENNSYDRFSTKKEIAEEEDLSLPSSILGNKQTEAVQTNQVEMAEA